MKRSKLVTIGLLAVSLASCHHRQYRHHTAVGSWNNDPSYYVSSGDDGYYQPGYPGVPFWFYYSMMYRPGYGVYYHPGVSFYARTSSGRISSIGWHVSEGGHVSRAGGTSRGGFGSSGRSVGA